MAARIRDFVAQGGGLIMAGGPTGFSGKMEYRGWGGHGGFGGTPIADVLPVEMLRDGDVVNATTKIGAIDTRHAVTAGLDWASIPAIHGHNRVIPKPRVSVLARTESNDPFLVVGSYGKGRTAAVTTSSARGWGSEFKTWPHYNRFWENLVQWAKG